jgi:glutathionylspermidine synthase
LKTSLPDAGYLEYVTAWNRAARLGLQNLNLDAWAGGHRYLSLVALSLTPPEIEQLEHVTATFGELLNRAVDGVLADPDWWPALAWPWAAIEFARQEPPHPGGHASLFGRFDCLLDLQGDWQVIEYNADMPSGGRELTGLEPPVACLHPDLERFSPRLDRLLVESIRRRLAARPHQVRLVGLVSRHSWLEDIAQAHWLAALLEGAGVPTLVGDIHDLRVDRKAILLRGRRIDALYRFYPVERLYRHPIFASLCEASLDGRLLLLNGLRAFLAQSKACLAWLWSNRAMLSAEGRRTIERHLPATLVARDPDASALLPNGVVKHVNGREGDSVVFGARLDDAAWEERLLEGGYVVQRAVTSPPLRDVEVDDWAREIRYLDGQTACVGAFLIGGAFSGCYTRIDGPITSPRARFVATLRERTSTVRRINAARAPRSVTKYASSPPT